MVRAAGEQLSSAVPSADVRQGTGEHIPLGDASVDAVVVAQAWHWMALMAALPEIDRGLVPGGTLSLVWTLRDNAEPWVAMLDSILHQHSRQDIDPEPGSASRSDKWSGCRSAGGSGSPVAMCSPWWGRAAT